MSFLVFIFHNIVQIHNNVMWNNNILQIILHILNVGYILQSIVPHNAIMDMSNIMSPKKTFH